LQDGQEVIIEVAGGNNKSGASSQTTQPSMRGFR